MPYCPIDENWFASFGEFIELNDGKICTDCGKKVGLVYGSESAKYGMNYSITDIKELIDAGKKLDLDSASNDLDSAQKQAVTVEVNVPEHVIITANSESVTINRKGMRSFANRGMNGEQLIPMASIIGVNFKKAGFAAGQINFVTAAGNQNTSGAASMMGGFANGAYNKANNVVFRSGHNDEMTELKSFVDKQIMLRSKPKPVAQTQSTNSAASEIRQFKQLLDDGIISQDEFDAKKKQLLGL